VNHSKHKRKSDRPEQAVGTVADRLNAGPKRQICVALERQDPADRPLKPSHANTRMPKSTDSQKKHGLMPAANGVGREARKMNRDTPFGLFPLACPSQAIRQATSMFVPAANAVSFL
jgi:hypothetical protein